jgi:hypothetical protein
MKLIPMAAVAFLVALATPAQCQQGNANNPAVAPQMVPPLTKAGKPNPLVGKPGFAVDPTMAPGSDPRPAVPFGSDPHPLNRPYPTTPNAGLGYSGQTGAPIAQYWVPPQAVALQVYVPQPEGVPDDWQTQYTEIPGYYVTETTIGYLYPDRWTIVSPAKGIYQWQRVPAEFRSK